MSLLSVNRLPALVLLAASAVSWAQVAPDNAGIARSGFAITVHVVLEDGSPLPTAPTVQITGASGESCVLTDSFASGTLQFKIAGWAQESIQEGQRGGGCLIAVSLAGYHTFRGFVAGGETIQLKRVGPHEGSSVSNVSLSAPVDAQKAYFAGEKALTKGKYPDAEKHLNEAVNIYPQYSLAWSELGRTFEFENRWDDALTALNHARQVDPNYIKPLVQLTELALRQQHWTEAMDLSDQTMALHPVEFPAAYYYRALAAFQLKRIADAERFAREAIQADPGGEYPDSLFLLATIMADRGETLDAITEFKSYLSAAPKGVNAKAAKDDIARLKTVVAKE